MIKLLIVDDSALARKLLGKIFDAEEDFDVRFARSGAEALAEIARDKPDVITLDINMPDMDGLACLDRIMIEQPCPVVMVSSLTDEGADLTLEALRRGAVDFISKPGRAISLGIEAMSAQLVEKTRNASRAKLRKSLRLRERVRHSIGTGWPLPDARPGTLPAPNQGHGLVLAGSSTGGPPALEALLTPLPADFPWPILVAQHMPASFTGPLARRLNQLCSLTILEVTSPILIAPGCVYIGHGDADIIVERHAEGLVVRPAASLADYLWHPSADRLVRSAMEVLAPEYLIGVLMTGMGNDGAAAMAALHRAGGRTIAESEETAVVWGMPGELVRAGGASLVLPVGDIAPQLRKLLA